VPFPIKNVLDIEDMLDSEMGRRWALDYAQQYGLPFRGKRRFRRAFWAAQIRKTRN